MNSTIVDIITPPSIEPVTLVEMRAHSRITVTDSAQDAVMLSCIKAARTLIENETGRVMITTTIRETLDAFPFGADQIVLHRSPVISLTSVTYTASDGTTTTLDPAEYATAIGAGVSRIGCFGTAGYWPSARIQPGAVKVTYVAGYGATAEDVPSDLRAAIRLLAAHYFENREAAIVGVTPTELPLAVRSIINCNRSGLMM